MTNTLISPNDSQKIGYLVVGHGTRKAAGQEQLLELTKQLAAIMSPAPVVPAFLELASPSIADGLRELASRGIVHFVTIPVLLFTAGHALIDIPQAVQTAAQEHGLVNVGQSPSLELHPAMVRLSVQRFWEAIDGAETKGGIGLALIGRGSSSSQATEAMFRFAEMRVQAAPVSFSTTGFIAIQKPTVCEALDQLDASTCELLVVQPHLLFEGTLVQELREKVQSRQEKSNRMWLITQPLGIDRGLALALAEVARDVLSID